LPYVNEAAVIGCFSGPNRNGGMSQMAAQGPSFPLMDPLRKEARFQALMRELKFPS
jgi:hypothetical protein